MKIRIAAEQDMAAVYALRFEVFVYEQSVPPEIELDEEDPHAIHILAEEDGEVIGCGRILLHGNDAHIGRLAVKKCRRGQGVGRAVCDFAIDICRKEGIAHIRLNAQLQAVGFYEKLGFGQQGTPFMEAGIEHIAMALSIEK